ncbi:ATP-binding cassette domain-containing protein [Streptacidiphilus cavernicola]|uniref:ATP-binding cassette domain-containing protein n=1 Tax=Streptacidiphilus cavernicola TaxID=3342716 RepID=A0ABV6VP96_9ACTN
MTTPPPAASTAPSPSASAAPPTGHLLSVRAVGKSYPRAGAVLDGVDLSVARGGTVGLVGESGSGKSTLARLVLGLAAPDTGAVRFDGQDPYRLRGRASRSVRARLQFVPQNPRGSLNPALRAGSAVGFVLAAQRTPRAERTELTAELFRQVGLDPALARRFPRELSGGQVQRVAIARALATGPDLVVCDEPTSALDRGVQAQVLDLLTELQQTRGLAYLFISHDLAVVRHLAHRVSVLRHGRVVEEGPADQVWDHPQHPYTRALLAASTGRTPPPAPNH